MRQNGLASLILGAGAGLVAAHPHAGHHGHSGTHSHKSTISFSSYTVASGSGVSLYAYAASSGTAYSTGTAVSVTASSAVAAASTASAVAVASSTAVVSAAASSSNDTSTSGSGATSGEVSAGTATSACTFTDLDSAVAGKADCTDIILSGIVVTAGETLDMTDLTDGTTVTFEGTTTFGYSEWDGPLISFSGTDITIQGATDHVIDMGGDQWWDGEGSNGGVTKPKGFYAHDLTDSTIVGLNILNTPIQCFSINGASNLYITDVTIDDSAGDGTDGGHNTDAFDIGSSTGVYISGAVVKNQDDCVAINSGTDISFTGGSCSGGHGLSIGSVGGRDDNTVENIYFADSTVSDSENGVRIKTISGDTGTVKNVTYSNIVLSGITDYGIVIEQDYENGSPTGTPTDGVPITELTLSGITGSVSDDAAPYYILCASCSDWTLTGVDITGGTASTDCEGEPSGVTLPLFYKEYKEKYQAWNTKMAPSDYNYDYFNVTFPAPYVAQVEINRPKKLNAFMEPMWLNIGAIFRRLSHDPDVRVVILTAAGDRAFTAGLDVQAAAEGGILAQSSSGEDVDGARKATMIRRHIQEFQDEISAIERCEKPVIGVLHGISYGLAIDMTTCCDIRICAKDTRFSVREVEIGLAADIGTLSRLPHANVPMSWVKDVCLTARDFGAEEALRVGFVSGVYETKLAALERALELGRLLASKSPVAVQSTKEVLNYSRDHTVADGLNYIKVWNAAALQTMDVKNAMLAGIQKRKATFSKL
ncbi:hypothetical protein LTR85_011243 [Meristemomyces frigidus]|nr:hypothetical protein LTR85_011243 [Meristemomyces frigidus]